jgi:2-keto-4-pentenoate hydratase
MYPVKPAFSLFLAATMSSTKAFPEWAQVLVLAYREHTHFVPGPHCGPADAASAYAIQQEVWRALAGEVRPSAWKIGAPDKASTPLAAPVLPFRLAVGPAHFPSGTFFFPGIEAEIAFRFGRDLPTHSRPYSREEILEAVASAHVAMELVDTRLADAEAAGPLWRLADNLLNGALVIGDAIPHWRALDFSGLTARVLADGKVLAESLGRPPLDDPFHCLPWWIDHIGGTRAGDIVTTGAWNGMHRLPPATLASVEFIGVGAARARIG